jgi:argininosuccinate lyase
VGGIVADAQRTGEGLPQAAARALAAVAPRVAARLDALFDADGAVRLRGLRGGTAPDAVRAALETALARVRSA